MMIKKRLFVFLAAISLILPIFVYAAQIPSDKYKEAQKLMPQAAELVQQGKLDDSLIILRQAIAIAPKEPDMHMNYATVLFVKGQQFFQFGHNDKTKKIFKEAQDELITAIKLYKARPDRDIKDSSKSQCYFLLGDIYYYIYKNDTRAKSLYMRSLEYNPKHAGSLEAIKRLSI
jgi:tetratricopeptide (TPR) repeat protein